MYSPRAETNQGHGQGLALARMASAGGAVGAFLAIFNLGTYDSYIAWPTQYHFPQGVAVSFQTLLLQAGAFAAAALVLSVTLLWSLRSRGLALRSAFSRGSLPLNALWLFPLLFVFSFRPAFWWLFVFLFLCSMASILVGASRPLFQRETNGKNTLSSTTGEAVPRLHMLLLAGGCLSFILLLSGLTILQYRAGNFGYADCGFTAEALWQTLQGRFLYCRQLSPPQLLSDHFSPASLMLLPLYAVVPRLETLIVISTFSLASTALPIYLLARREWESSSLALCPAFGFLLFPPAQHEVSSFSYGFQAGVLAVPLFAWAVYFMRCHAWRRFWLFLVLALCCKETMAALVLGLGLAAAVLERDWRRGGATAVLALVWLALTTQLLMPWLRLGQDYPQFTYFFSHLGQGPGEIAFSVLKIVFTEPAKLAAMIFRRELWVFLGQMLLPLGLLSLLSPGLMLAGLPHFVLMVFSREPHMFSIFQHYKDPLLCLPFVAAIVGTGKFAKSRQYLEKSRDARSRFALSRGASCCLLVCGLMHTYYFGPTPISKSYEPRLYATSAHAEALTRMKQRVPGNVSIAATQRAAAHFTDRPKLYVLGTAPRAGGDFFAAEYLLLDAKDRWGDPSGKLVPGLMHELEQRGDFTLIQEDDGFYLFRNLRAAGRP